ncbi:MAG: hypothetical protein ABI200_03675 [Gaiellales bacterium]
MSRSETATAARRQHPVRVRGAEVSTEQETFGAYAETFALLVAITTVAAVAWMLMLPSSSATLTIPAPGADLAAATAEVSAGGELIQPNPYGPSETIAIVDAGAAAPAVEATSFSPAAS